jgi:hypothetical protein
MRTSSRKPQDLEELKRRIDPERSAKQRDQLHTPIQG